MSFTVLQTILPLVFGRHLDILLILPFLELTRLSIPSDITTFVLVLGQVQLIKSKHQGMNKPRILDRISRDAEMYFAIITMCHFLTAVTYFTVKVGFFTPVSEFYAWLTIEFFGQSTLGGIPTV